MKRSLCYQCKGVASTRREFLRVGSLGFLGIGLGDYLRLSSATAFAAERRHKPSREKPRPVSCFGWRVE